MYLARRLLEKFFPKRLAEPTRDTTARAQLTSLHNSMGCFIRDLGRPPRCLDELCENLDGATGWDGPYVSRNDLATFEDPWGYPYEYMTNGENYTIESRGLLGYDRDYG